MIDAVYLMKSLVIVESPTKAKTIRKFISPDYIVTASMGHVRDLPSSSADVPEKFKKTPAGQLGVDVDHDFEPLYIIPKNKMKVISDLRKMLKEADQVYLATDDDREGESISWHLLDILKPKVPVHRMVFHEITKTAIQSALEHPRALDERLVRAQETRRILDRLVGYTVSPVLWKKISYGLSAGRVQSVALKAIVDRERSRMRFVKASYWDVDAKLRHLNEDFDAHLMETGGKKLVSGKDFDEDTGTLKSNAKDLAVLDQTQAEKIALEVQQLPWRVRQVTEKPVSRKPPAPFITSTLQQEANRKLGLTSKEAMRVAQSLYEHGFITYMRTDSTALSNDALQSARQTIKDRFGVEYIPDQPRHYSSVKAAQEAHEAIRPSLTYTPPQETGLSGAERDLYELIWMRTLASQMKDSQQLQIAAHLEVGTHVFTANGLKILFPGFLRAYVEGTEDAEQALSEKERLLPELKEGDQPVCQKALALGHETKPPSRYTEASLIQYMEKEGIGRPSTYASIIGTLIDRGYVKKAGSALSPTFTAFAVTQLLEKHFSNLVDAGFTSKMEKSLDEIADGKQEWLPYLRAFFLGETGLQHHIEVELKQIDPEEARRVDLPGQPDTIVHVGKFGPYFEGIHPRSHTRMKASIPDDISPGDFTPERVEELLQQTQQGPTTLGIDPATGLQMYLKTGSYGPYLQLGEEIEGSKQKPKRASVPKHIPLDQLSHDKAVALLGLPRTLGTHPQTGKEIKAGNGRFGPYIVHDGDFRSLKAEDDVLTVQLSRALELLAQPKGKRGSAAPLRTLGEDPTTHTVITVHKGKFGMYVKQGDLNATLPKELHESTVTLEQALAILAERASKAPVKPKRKRKT